MASYATDEFKGIVAPYQKRVDAVNNVNNNSTEYCSNIITTTIIMPVIIQ